MLGTIRAAGGRSGLARLVKLDIHDILDMSDDSGAYSERWRMCMASWVVSVCALDVKEHGGDESRRKARRYMYSGARALRCASS